MLRKTGKVCIGIMITFLLALIAWYFFLIEIPKEYCVQGTAAPVMTKEEALDLMDYHGIKVIWAEDGKWVFERDGKIVPLLNEK